MNDYIDEKIIPIKVSNTDESHQSLEEGYYISGRLETFSKEKYFDAWHSTLEAVNSTGVLQAIIDGPNHVKVIPTDPLELPIWMSTRETAKENPYYLTKILASIFIRDNGGPCNVSSDW